VWKSVYLLAVSSAALTHIVPLVYYNGVALPAAEGYPTVPLTDATHLGFTVAVRAHFYAPAPVSGAVTVRGNWSADAVITVPASLPAGDSNLTLTLGAGPGEVGLWWPAGMGARPFYSVSVTFQPGAAALPAVTASRRIAFRVFTLVTGNDTIPATLAGKDGSGGFTMRFRVNGASLWSRGANQVPMEELEGRQDALAYRRLAQSAADAGFNTLRLWGGGIFMPDVWYDALDELGVLVRWGGGGCLEEEEEELKGGPLWGRTSSRYPASAFPHSPLPSPPHSQVYHDAMYAQQGHSPAQTPTQDAELRHQVRRLSHHPSIALWDSCNEW
jgi:beta-mannosidase